MIYEITVQEVKLLAHQLAKAHMQWNEPIPPFKTRFAGKLESCLAAPFQTFDRKQLVVGLNRKAAFLFYLMIKNHPFENGNKRIAVTTLLCFLLLNNRWLDARPDDLYENAVWVAKSKAKDKDNVINIIESFIEDSIKNLK